MSDRHRVDDLSGRKPPHSNARVTPGRLGAAACALTAGLVLCLTGVIGRIDPAAAVRVGRETRTQGKHESSGTKRAPEGTIAYSCVSSVRPSNDVEICTLDLSARREARITHGSSYSVGPVWSPDGARVAFVCHQSRLTKSEINKGMFPMRDLIDFSILGFERRAGGDVCTVTADGREQRQLTTTNGHALAPTWSPDGTHLAFVRTVALSHRARVGTSHSGSLDAGIFVVSLDGSGQRQVTNMAGDDFPAWSPDGRQLAFTDAERIAVTSTDGTARVQLTKSPPASVSVIGDPQLHEGWEHLDVAPSWSPDGARIAFTRLDFSGALPKRTTWVMNNDGTGRHRLTSSPFWEGPEVFNQVAFALTPRWSPDGQHLAVTTIKNSQAQVTVVTAMGRSTRVVTPRTPRDGADGSLLANWAPDGEHLVFTSDRNGPINVYAVAINGIGLARLTTQKYPRFEPSWRPTPDESEPKLPRTPPG